MKEYSQIGQYAIFFISSI